MIGQFEVKNENKYLVWMMWRKIKKFQRNMKNFGKVLKRILKRLMVAKSRIRERF